MLYTSPQDLEIWFDQLELLETNQKCNGPQFIKPFHLATLTHKLRQQKISKLSITESLSNYADTVKHWHALDIAPTSITINRWPDGRYHPIELLKNSNSVDDIAEKLTELFSTACKDVKTLDGVNTMLRELIGNCYAHSDVTDGVFGVVCAQIWPKENKAQIVIADTGIGIRTSLMQNLSLYPKIENENCCELSTEYGITGKPGKGHSGYGLTVARKLIEQNNGNLIVRSGTEMFCYQSGNVTSKSSQRDWEGTLLLIEWDINAQMNIGKVYESFPLPEGMTDDDFSF